VVLVGEQPGDQEDRRGAPFVGPAGRLLDRALEEAGIDRSMAYVTNAVKHFKFTQSAPGKRRIHATPDTWEVQACRPWLTAELALLEPEVVVALGATAGKALLGPSFRVTKQRGLLLPWPGERPAPVRSGTELTLDDALVEPPEEDAAPHNRFVLATLHPSAVLRADDQDAAYAGVVADLRVAAGALA
jgi:DNA polymerase